jgi:hypothetical protein
LTQPQLSVLSNHTDPGVRFYDASGKIVDRMSIRDRRGLKMVILRP